MAQSTFATDISDKQLLSALFAAESEYDRKILKTLSFEELIVEQQNVDDSFVFNWSGQPRDEAQWDEYNRFMQHYNNVYAELRQREEEQNRRN